MTVVRCPFPPCYWEGEPPVRKLPIWDGPRLVGSTETNSVLPIHEVVGPHEWFGRCPGSQLVVPVTARGAEVVQTALAAFVRALRGKVEQHYAKWDAQRPETFDEILDKLRAGYEPPAPTTDGIADALLGKAHGVPPSTVPDYFPGRPADAPEPGPGDPPDTPPPAAAHADITPLGGAVDNARDNLTAMILAARASATSLIAELLAIRARVEQAQSALVAADMTAVQTLSLMRIAVGADLSGAPQVAQDMVAMTNFGRTTMVGNGVESVTWSLDATHNALTAAIARIQAGEANATAYAAMPR